VILEQLGWQSFFKEAFRPYEERGLLPARIARVDRGQYLTISEAGQLPAQLAGKLHFTAASRADFPAVGDWVALAPRQAPSRSTIHGVLPRLSKFSRKEAGDETVEQILAANVTKILLVSGLDGEFNPRRIERYLTLAWGSGAEPVIVLNKADLCADLTSRMEQVAGLAAGAPVLAVSGTTGEGLPALRAVLREGDTVAFLGSSGVGKSTLVNALLGEERLAVGDVRPGDSKGRHTTTHRELVLLPGGGVLIDTPGMRELQLWGEEAGLASAFADIESLAAGCRFEDCRHDCEPGCRVLAAIASGELPPERLRSYLKMQKELRYLAGKEDALQRRNSKARWKTITKAHRRQEREEGGRRM